MMGQREYRLYIHIYIFLIISYASHVPFYSISTLWSFILQTTLPQARKPLAEAQQLEGALIFRLYGRRLLIRALGRGT